MGARRRVPGWRVLTAVGTAVAAGLGLAACSSGPAGSHRESVFALAVGQCLVPPTKVQAELTSIEVVPCTDPHTQQVYAVVHDGAGSYPTPAALSTFANAHCLDDFAGFVGVSYQKSSLYFTYLLPSVRSWAAGDRSVVCVVESVQGPLRRSVQGSKL